MESMLEKIKNPEVISKSKKILCAVVIGVTVIGVSVAAVDIATRKNSYAVSVDGEVVAIVREKEEAEEVYKEIIDSIQSETEADIAVNETVSVEYVHSKAEEINSKEDLQEILADTISYNRQAVEILVDGVSYGIVDSEEVALDIFRHIAQLQLSEDERVELDVVSDQQEQKLRSSETSSSEETEVESEMSEEEEVSGPQVITIQSALEEETVNTKVSVGSIEPVQLDEKPSEEENVEEENVEEESEEEKTEGQVIIRERMGFDFYQDLEIRSTYVSSKEIIEEEEMIDILLSNTDEVIEYEMQSGDNIWDLAIANNTTMDRILEINPQIEDETKMQIGEIIRIEAPDPIVSIRTVEEATFKQVIPAEIEYVEFSDLYKDETKVYEEGYDGLKEIHVSVEKVNGREVDRELLSETILSEPKTKVIAYGTQERPSNGASSSVTPPSNSSMFMHPLAGAGTFTSGYGTRWGSFHSGIDIAASYGTPIYAAAAGTVTFSGWNSGGYGYLVIIDHGNGYETYYAHNSKNYVQVGQKVSKGQNIAAVGSTGNSTGNHVHFEIRRNGSPINPYSYVY